MSKCADIVAQAKKAGLKTSVEFLVTPGSEMIYETLKRDGLLKEFEDAGAKILNNACGPCIGQWNREDVSKREANAIVTSFNRYILFSYI